MIKIITILNEIKVVNPNFYFPKDKDWIYKVDNFDQVKGICDKLNKLGYAWGSYSDHMNVLPSAFYHDENYPIYIFHILNFAGLSISTAKYMKELGFEPVLKRYGITDPLKLNFK